MQERKKVEVTHKSTGETRLINLDRFNEEIHEMPKPKKKAVKKTVKKKKEE
jgi:hypothetical protein